MSSFPSVGDQNEVLPLIRYRTTKKNPPDPTMVPPIRNPSKDINDEVLRLAQDQLADPSFEQPFVFEIERCKSGPNSPKSTRSAHRFLFNCHATVVRPSTLQYRADLREAISPEGYQYDMRPGLLWNILESFLRIFCSKLGVVRRGRFSHLPGMLFG